MRSKRRVDSACHDKNPENSTMMTKDRIAEILRQALKTTEVEVEDESALHVGHVGAASGGGHYHVTVVSALFEGKSRVERHRMVYEILAAEMRHAIHALALTTLAPSQRR
jgi:BolA family transcriptional regulator, general stress-responsive regulator